MCVASVAAYGQSMSAGASHSVFVCADGEATATGANTFGQLGNGSFAGTATPVPVSGLTEIVATSSRDQFTLYLLSDSTVWAAGYNGFGQLGNGTTENASTPVQIPNLTGVARIAAGTYHSLFLLGDSTVWSCGRNFSGELGDGTQAQRTTPVQVTSLSGIVDIAAGDYHSMFLRSDSTVWACGDNQNGCLGLGFGAGLQVVGPTQVASLSGVTRIAGGFRHSLFVRGDSTVWASGYNSQGQQGNGTNLDNHTPAQITSLSDVVGISAGLHHSLFLKDDGTVWSAGSNLEGQLGNGNNLDQNIPVQVSGITDAVEVYASGGQHSLFRISDNTFWACGQNNGGQLGIGNNSFSNVPVLVNDGCIVSDISELSGSIRATVYPNPSEGIFHFLMEGAAAPVEHVEIVNLAGEWVYSGRPAGSMPAVDLSDQPGGVYFFRVTDRNQHVSTGRIVLE